MEQLEGEMREVVAGAERFRRMREGQTAITVRRVVGQALGALRRLGDTLRHVLPPRDFVWVASRLVQALAERIAGPCPPPFASLHLQLEPTVVTRR